MIVLLAAAIAALALLGGKAVSVAKKALSIIVPDSAVYGFVEFDVQGFLDAKGGALAKLRFSNDGSKASWPFGNTAASIIHDAAHNHDVKAQYLLVTLQREQGLIEGSSSKSPTQNQLDWATGYGVPDSGAKKTEYKGFPKQVNMAASATRSGIAAQMASNSVGKSVKLLDGTAVPANKATAFFYAYTPHADAGHLTKAIYSRFGFA